MGSIPFGAGSIVEWVFSAAALNAYSLGGSSPAKSPAK